MSINLQKYANNPALYGELNSIDVGTMDLIISNIKKLFKQSQICGPSGYNIKKIQINSRFDDGMAKSGNLEWAIDVRPKYANYELTAYMNVSFDDNIVKLPLVFFDNHNNAHGFSEASLKRWLFAGADLQDIIPVRHSFS